MKLGKGDCEEFAYFYKDVLNAGYEYYPATVVFVKGEEYPTGHSMCAFRENGNIVLLSNHEIIRTPYKSLEAIDKFMYPNSIMRIIR